MEREQPFERVHERLARGVPSERRAPNRTSVDQSAALAVTAASVSLAAAWESAALSAAGASTARPRSPIRKHGRVGTASNPASTCRSARARRLLHSSAPMTSPLS